MSEDETVAAPTSLPPIAPETTEVPESAARSRPRPKVTFMGNSYDLMAVVAVVTGGVIAFSCVTCNMGFYCLPFVPIALGLVGLLSAEESVEPSRTRLLSWLGIGGGLLFVVLMALFILAYVALIAITIAAGAASAPSRY